MTHVHRGNSFSFVLIPFAVMLILLGFFSIVWLRSSVRTMEYSISRLEDQRMKAIKERKMLMAEKASLSAIYNVKNTGTGKSGFVFPDRVKVIYVKRGENTTPYKVSFEGRRSSD